ncbi:MAG TPA: penicillin-binding protein 2 [Thermoanaerobaculia bacterium]|nr:penicillin-binding protein 2 [Thermoanaerobaculia bacterium]HUM29342.1 penicillin-binding protein 2 [Thermoanaerobaculia bacterium]HXK67588.1 penicillin-binding protein 2 [Thermoanaerobaculia bacterium]
MDRKRLIIFLACLSLWGAVILWRLADLQLLSGDQYANDVLKALQIEIEETPRRGMIYDREGRILAMSLTVPSICAYPPFIKDADDVASRLAPLLKERPENIRKSILSPRQFVWLARQVSPSTGDAIFRMKLRGVGIRYEYKRIYPHGLLAGKVLGTVGVDHHGLGGLEYAWDKQLSGVPGRRILLKDARRNDIDLNMLVTAPIEGRDLHTSIDAVIQHLAEKEAILAAGNTGCIDISITVMDPSNGEILAHALAPPTDPSTPATYTTNGHPDWLAKGVYEPGSTLKPMVASFAFEEHRVDPLELINGENGVFEYKGKRIRDHEPYGLITFEDALIHSSNVVFAKVGMRLTPERFYRRLQELGFGDRTGIDLPGEERGLFPRYEDWRENTPAYMALGQELAVTNAQLIQAYSALARDGSSVVPHFNRELAPIQRRIMDADHVARLKMILVEVTKRGTGMNAALAWAPVAGKTGTAQKPIPGQGYVLGKYVSSFIGWFPVEEPKYLILVMLNEPRGRFYGGDVAAPIFHRLADAICIRGEIHET